MASKEFQKRFKNRSTVISSNGVLKTNPNNMIEKPSNRHVHSTLLDYESNSTPNPFSSVISPVSNSSDKSIFFHSSMITKTDPFSYSKTEKNINPSQSEKIISKSFSSHYAKKMIPKTLKTLKYKPYTLKEYKNVKPNGYYTLGGLGSSNILPENWKKKEIQKNKSYKDNIFNTKAKFPLISAEKISQNITPKK